MSHWMYPANTKLYDVIGAFSKEQAVWPISSKVEVGDTVYLYLSAPHKKIAYICKVKEVGLSRDLIHEYSSQYMKKTNVEKPPTKDFMMLSHIRTLPASSEKHLSYDALKDSGLNGMLMGPRKLENNQSLFDYIRRCTHAL